MDGMRGRAVRVLRFLQSASWFFSGVSVLGVCLLFRIYSPADSAAAAGKPPASGVKRASATEPAKGPASAQAKAPEGPVVRKPQVAAVVNNEPISREDLARECLLHYGNEVLESVISRTLILASCQQRSIVITDKQIDAEIDRMARKFAMSKDQWLKTLEKERGIKPVRYSKDIIWPTLALRELAKNQLKVTQQELDEAYESEFGPGVKVRLIALDTQSEARRVHAEALAKPDEFPSLAKKYSKDSSSASAYGLIQPIRHHMGDPKLEAAAFALEKGQISPIVKVGNLYAFVKCEEHIAPAKGMERAKVDPLLIEALKDRKLRAAANDVFKELQKEAVIENVYNDPAKSKQNPGVAATINGQKITILELAEECIERHGPDVLEGTINRRLLDQALRKRKLTVADADIEREIGRAAESMGIVKDDGTPDVDLWIANVLKNENITREVYVRDEVWPSVALKKLVGDKVQITQEDLNRGYEANYGPKVRCRAIVVNNPRRAQELWEKIRDKWTADPKNTLKYFGDLAEQYSVEAGSRALRGEVPPIQKFGGQPAMEKEAFTLSEENPLSGIIQVADNYIILYYEGQTESIGAKFDEVKELLYRDIHEKKLRVAMAKIFEELKESARIDNYLVNNFKLAKKEEQDLAKDPSIPQPKVIKR